MNPIPYLLQPPNAPVPGLGEQLATAQQGQQQLARLPAPMMAAPMAGPSLPALSAAVMPAAHQNQVLTDEAHRNYLLNSGSGVQQITHPVDANGNPTGQHIGAGRKILGGLATAGDIATQIAGSVFLPAHAVAAAIPGTTFHHQMLLHQATQNLANDQAAAQQDAVTQGREAMTQDQLAQTGEREALASKYGSQAQDMAPVLVTPEMAQAAGIPELAGSTVSQPTYQKLFTGTQTNQTRQTVAAGHDATHVQTTGMNNQTSLTNNQNTNQTRESISDASNKTRTLVADMHDQTSRANNQNTNAHKGAGAVTADGMHKVPADVTKRAALAHNVTENADAVDALLQQRPDIVGAAGGRYSTVQQMIGSDDPAIAELGVRMHNIALASNGAHGVRAQQAIAQTEDELFHHFKSGPSAIHSSLNATRGSMQTFLDDEKNYQQSGQRTGSTDKAADPLGIR